MRFLVTMAVVKPDPFSVNPIFRKPFPTDLLFFAFFIILFLLVFREFFFTNRVFFERDTTLVEVPVKQLTVQLLKEGRFALWTDSHGNGQPFLANPKNAVFYPTTWLYLFLPFFAAFKLHYLIHILGLWLGVYVLLGSYSLTKKASFLGASLFAFSGMVLSSFEFYSHVAALAWMPWVLLLLHRDRLIWRGRIIAIAALWTLMILAGAPEFILMTLVFATGQAFFLKAQWKRRLLLAGFSLLVATAVSAVQVLPSIELLSQTERAAASAQWPLDLVQLANMPFAHLFGDNRGPGHDDFWGSHLFDRQVPLYYSLYVGFGALILAAFGLQGPRDRCRLIFLLIGAAFFLLSCGRYSPFFFLYKFVPLLSSIRYPVKFFLGSVFCLSILAAHGFDNVISAKRPARKAVNWLAAAATVGLVLFALFRRPIVAGLNELLVISRESSFHELSRSIWTGILLLAIYALILELASRTRRMIRPLGVSLLILVVLDPAFHNRYINPTVPASFFAPPAIPSSLGRSPIIYRDEFIPSDLGQHTDGSAGILAHFYKTFYPLTGLGTGVRYVFNEDFYGAYPRRYTRIWSALKTRPAKDQWKVLEYVGCAARIGERPYFLGRAERVLVDGSEMAVERIAKSRAWPYVSFNLLPVSPGAEAADLLSIFLDDSFDPHNGVVAQMNGSLVMPSGILKSGSGEVLVRKEAQGWGAYSVRLTSKGVFVVPGNAAPGWRALIDGRKAEVFEANLFAKGVVVPAGNHEIVLRYLPDSFLWGAAISLAAIILVPAGLLILEKRSRKRARLASL